MIGTSISHYEVLEELGRGGMGILYRARDIRLEHFAVVWTSVTQDGSVDRVFGQRFGPILAVALTQFTVE